MKFEERQVLLKKYMRERGLTFEEAKIEINKFDDDIKEFAKKLRKQRMSERDITEEVNKRFKKKFEKLCGR